MVGGASQALLTGGANPPSYSATAHGAGGWGGEGLVAVLGIYYTIYILIIFTIMKYYF